MNLDFSVLEKQPFLGIWVTVPDLQKLFSASLSKFFHIEKDDRVLVQHEKTGIIHFIVTNIRSKEGQLFARIESQITTSQLLEITFQQIFKKEEALDSYNKNIFDNLSLVPVYNYSGVFDGFYVMLNSTDVTLQIQPIPKNNKHVFSLPFSFNTFFLKT